MGFQINTESFGQISGRNVLLYTITNADGVEFSVSNYGAILVSYKTLDKQGIPTETVLGFDGVDAYTNDKFYFGATIGRYAGRINNGRAIIDGVLYQFAQNERGNTLHGGNHALNSQIWQAKIIKDDKKVSIEFHYHSPHLDNGFPGNVNFVARYTLSTDHNLHISYFATTDQATIINMTNHSYYSLAPIGGDTLDHIIYLNAVQYVEVNDKLIPTGEILDCINTPYDLNIRDKLFVTTIEQLSKIGKNDLDLSYILPQQSGGEVLALDMSCKTTARGLRFYTNQPIIHVFTSDGLQDTVGRDLKNYMPYAGLAVECQNFSDAPNHANFNSSILRPGEEYHSHTRIEPYLSF